MTARTITVPLAGASYDILVGADVLARLPAVLAAACPAARYALIADSAVAARYGETVRALAARVARCDLFAFPAGEWNKTREQWGALSDALLASGHGRDAAVVALGGGVTGDLAGFVAATYLRGVPYVQVPTTLLAMIDSSIGGKTGVDTPHGKNLIGAFHQPQAVVADVRTLDTLPPPHLAAGVAEALKHGAVADAGYFGQIVTDREAILARDPETLVRTVARSVEIKASVVAADEREAGGRATLNFGHTVAHAIEVASGYELLHGEAVAIGMVTEARLGHVVGVTAPEVEPRLREALEAFDLPVEPPPTSTEGLLEVMARDKKVRGGTVKFALLERLGQSARSPTGSWTFDAPEEAIRKALESPRHNANT